MVSVCAGAEHGPFKPVRDVITLTAGLGVEGDAHFGRTVQHRSRARAHPDWENLRQVHLIDRELLDELAHRGYELRPGQMGENVLTRGADLLSLPTGTTVRLGAAAVVELTGLRNPCSQLDGVTPGLMAAVLDRRPDGRLIRRCGVMARVITGGEVRPGDCIVLTPPQGTPRPLAPV